MARRARNRPRAGCARGHRVAGRVRAARKPRGRARGTRDGARWFRRRARVGAGARGDPRWFRRARRCARGAADVGVANRRQLVARRARRAAVRPSSRVRPRFGDADLSLRRVVRRKGFRDLLIGQTVSGLGDWMGTVAFMALALELTGSPTAVGGVLVLRLLPAAIGGPLAARAVRSWDRRRTMLAMDAVRAGIIA